MVYAKLRCVHNVEFTNKENGRQDILLQQICRSRPKEFSDYRSLMYIKPEDILAVSRCILLARPEGILPPRLSGWNGRTWQVGMFEAYVASLHWSLTQFTPSTNNVAPANSLERWGRHVVCCLFPRAVSGRAWAKRMWVFNVWFRFLSVNIMCTSCTALINLQLHPGDVSHPAFGVQLFIGMSLNKWRSPTNVEACLRQSSSLKHHPADEW